MTYGLDKYGSTLRDVLLLDGTHLNQELVKDGWCWWYRKYAPDDTVLEGLEQETREAKIGLWADPLPVPPWEWRKSKRCRLTNEPSAGPISHASPGSWRSSLACTRRSSPFSRIASPPNSSGSLDLSLPHPLNSSMLFC